jgi:hypothetical protein
MSIVVIAFVASLQGVIPSLQEANANELTLGRTNLRNQRNMIFQ